MPYHVPRHLPTRSTFSSVLERLFGFHRSHLRVYFLYIDICLCVCVCVCVCVCMYVWAAVSAGLSLAVPAFLTLYVIVTVLDELNKRNETNVF